MTTEKIKWHYGATLKTHWAKNIWSCRLISAVVRDTSAGWPLWNAEPETKWLQVTLVQILLRVRTHLCVYLSWVSADRWVCVGSWTFWPALTTPATSRRSLWHAVFRSEPAALTPPCRRHRWSPPEGRIYIGFYVAFRGFKHREPEFLNCISNNLACLVFEARKHAIKCIY